MRTPPDGLSGGDPVWVVRACEDSLTPPRDRPDRRLPAAHARRLDADRRHAHRDVSARRRGEGPRDRVFELLREAAGRGGGGRDGAKGVRRFVTVQNEYSLLAREAREEVLPACRRLGLSFMPYFPLASGLLTGKYREGQPPPPGSRMAGPRRLGRVPDRRASRRRRAPERRSPSEHGHTILELAMSWLAIAAGDRHRDRRGDQCRAGSRERRGGRGVAALRRRVRRDRRPPCVAG